MTAPIGTDTLAALTAPPAPPAPMLGPDAPEDRAKAEHRARCEAGRARKLLQDSRTARKHVAKARGEACFGLEGEARAEKASEFSAERRDTISKHLDGSTVKVFAEHVAHTKVSQRVSVFGTALVNDGAGFVKVLVKGEVSVRDSLGIDAHGAEFKVSLARRVKVDKHGVAHYSYDIRAVGDASKGAHDPFRIVVSGVVRASEYVRLAVETAVNA